jgi:hypothetical protein
MQKKQPQFGRKHKKHRQNLTAMAKLQLVFCRVRKQRKRRGVDKFLTKKKNKQLTADEVEF